jgi:hypothetical protein
MAAHDSPAVVALADKVRSKLESVLQKLG